MQQGRKSHSHRAHARARLDDCAFVIDGAIETLLGMIRLRRWRRKRSQRVCLQTLHHLTWEGSHGEVMQGTISNLLDGEVCEFHCRGSTELDLTIVADGITTKSQE